MSKKLKIAVITQNDVYAIPRNFKLLCDAEELNIAELIVINASGSLENKRMLFLLGFGFYQATKMASVTVFFQLLSLFASLIRSPKNAQWLNLKGLCTRYDIPFRKEQDVNDGKLLGRLKASELDVIVSFSAPSVFKSAVTRGHEISLHGTSHKRPLEMSLDEFEVDCHKGMKSFQENLGFVPCGYRASCFSLDRDRMDILKNKFDLSYDASRMDFDAHPLYGSLDMTGFNFDG